MRTYIVDRDTGTAIPGFNFEEPLSLAEQRIIDSLHQLPIGLEFTQVAASLVREVNRELGLQV